VQKDLYSNEKAAPTMKSEVAKRGDNEKNQEEIKQRISLQCQRGKF